MVADRLGLELAWDRKAAGDPQGEAPAAFRREAHAGPNLLPQLMREAARALQAAEARAAALEQHVARAAEAEEHRAEALRAEQARADAAEARAKAAEERLAALETRALAAIRVLERRAEVAEARVHAAENWIERVRSALASGPDDVPPPAEPFSSKLDALIA